MTLSTIGSLHLAPGRVNLALRYVVVVVCAASAGVHAALVPEHLPESRTLALAFALSATLGRTSTITKALSSVGIKLYPSFTIYGFVGICLAYTYFQVPFMVLIMTPALDGLRHEWREAAHNLGATKFQYWRLVAVPILMPSLLSAMALLFANAFGAYATAALLVGGGSGGTLIISLQVAGQFSTDSFKDNHQGYALAFGMIIVVAVTIVIYTWSRQRAERWRQSGT